MEIKNTGDATATGGGVANTGLNVHPEVAALASEAQMYAWKKPTAIMDTGVLQACREIGRAPEGGLPYAELEEWIRELGRYEADYNRLAVSLGVHTKREPGFGAHNAVDAAINILEVAHLTMQHLTPAVAGILRSVLSALDSVGVDVPSLFTPTEPSLGLATTAEILRELECRGRGSWDYLPRQMLRDLTEETLNYRTVDDPIAKTDARNGFDAPTEGNAGS